MSNLLAIGLSGIQTYQTAMSATAENVSNADTPGFTRRTATIVTQSSGGSQVLYKNTSQFGGSGVQSVQRAWDDFKAAAARTAASEAGNASARLTWLGNAEQAMPDNATGVGQSATAFFDSAATLASNPNDAGGRSAMLETLGQTVDAFNATAGTLKQTSDSIADTAQTTVKQINTDLGSLDQINRALRAEQPGTPQRADLEDKRDQLIDGLASQLAVTVTLDDRGAATLKLPDGTALSGGLGDVGGARLTTTAGSDGRLSVQAVQAGTVTGIADPGGALGGLVESASAVADRRTQLDTLAANFAGALATWQAAGVDPSGNPGQPLVTGTSAATLTLATSDPNAIAAASPTPPADPAATTPPIAGAANGNLLALSALRGSGGVEQGWATMVTRQATLVSAAQSQSTAASAQKDAADTALASLTGVDLDTEAANLMKYQQAYNGAAKVIQVARDTMQSILDLF